MMKKIIFLTILFFVLLSCEFSPKKTNAEMINLVCTEGNCITYERRMWDGYEWAVFSTTHYYSMAPFVINLTKERLEIEKLELEIEKLKAEKEYRIKNNL